MVWIDLIYNLALLVALSVVSGFVDTRWKRHTRFGAVLQGVVFGGAAVIGMLRPFVFAPGLIFDGRSVMISLGALFFGPWTAAVACLMTIPLRVVQGGPGALMGVSVILASAAIGVGFHRRRPPGSREVSVETLLVFGILVHLAMLALTVALPREMILPVLKRIGWPVILTYPLATVLIGKILSDQAARAGFLESLQENERRFRAIFNSTFQFTGLLTPDGTLTEANQSALDFAGIKREEVLHRPFWEARWWRGNEARVRQLREAIARAAGGEFVRYEVTMQGAGATTAIVDFSLKPVLDAAGRVMLLIPEGRDITERKQAEAALASEIEMRRELFARSPDGIVILDPETARPVEFNETAHRQLGYSREEFARLSIFDLEAAETPEETRLRIQTVLRGGRADFETQQRTRQGEIRDVHVTAQTIKIQGRDVYHCVWRDITERKRSERALRESEERFTRIVETLPNGVAILNLQGQITFANSGAEQLLGLSRGGITQRTYNDPAWRFMTVDDRPFPDEEQPFSRVVHSGEAVYGVEQVVEQPDGRRVALSINAAPLCDAAGNLIGTVAAFTDVTERKQTEHTLRESEERYRSLFTSMQEGFALHELICDGAGRPQDYRYLEVNPAFEQMTGIPRERWVGHTVREVLPDIEDYWIQGFGEVALTGVARTFENDVKELGRHYEVLAYCPKPGLFAVLSLDVTQRRQVETALRQKTEELDRYFSTALDLFCIVDHEGRFRRLNRQWEQTLGYSLAELEGHSFLEFVHPEDREMTEQTNRRALVGLVRNFVNRYRRKDGEYRWIEWTSHPSGTLVFAAARDITERKQAQAQLERSHALYRGAIVAADAVPYQKDYASDSYVFMGERIKDILGYAPSELRSSVWREIILETVFMGEAVGLTVAEAARRALAGEIKHWRADHRVRTRSGEIRWISDASIPLFNDAGKYVGSMGIIQDITERKQAEEAVWRSKVSLARAQRVGRLGSWEYDVARGTLEWSDETYRIFGQSPEVFTPGRESFLALVHAEDRVRVRTAFEQALATARAYLVDHRIVLPDGAERVVSERADVVTDVGGQVLQLVGTVQDVSELKRIEQALQRSERHFRSIIDTVQDLISIVDIGGFMRFISPSAERALGYAPEQLLDREVFDFIPAEEHAIVRAALARALGDPHQPNAVQHHFRHKDGSWRFFESIGNLLGGESAQALVVNSRDITERRRLEEQLRQSQKMEAIGQLAAGVAHDFNNILTIIQGNASLLLGTPGIASEGAVSMTQIIEASERAAGLTRQLLMFSRKQVMQLAELDLNEVVGHMTKMLQRILGEDITLRSEYAPNLPLIRADAGMLEQVLLNLAVNARDAMPGGGQLLLRTEATQVGEQEVAQHPGARAGLHIRLRVADTGCGIAPENLVRIFDPFFTTKEVGKGTGLGLATVYGIVNQHHGWIEVASEVGRGTEFQIYLPACEGSVAARRGASAIQELPRGNEVILVVEDEQAVRLLVSNLLQRCGYTVLLAESGVAALTVWQQHKDKVALLLTDMVMPDGMSGRDLARELQQDRPGLRVIFTSGYSATTGGESPALTEGVNFLQKPYPPHHLAKTVRACLDRK